MTNTNSALAFFDFQGQQVRVITVAGEPWWVANDVCAVLEIAKTDRALIGLDDDEKGAHTVRTPGGDQRVSVINEPGLYSLVLRSRKPQARAFKRWVTHEVIPSIRRTGRYAVEDRSEVEVPPEMAAFFRFVARAATEAFATEARTASRDAAAIIAEALGAMDERLTSAIDGNTQAIHHLGDRIVGALAPPAIGSGPVPRLPGQGGRDPDAAAAEPVREPIWHSGIPDGAMPFGALADVLSIEFGRPELSRDQLFAIARDAGLLRQLTPPYSGNTLTDVRLSNLFKIRRISGANHGWPCSHHYQPLAMPQGVTIMRQLVAQDVVRGVL